MTDASVCVPYRAFKCTYFLAETNRCTLAKMFNCTLLFITPTCFGHSCDHLQVVAQQGYRQYVGDYTESVKKNIPWVLSIDSSKHPIVKYQNILKYFVKTW